MTQGMHCCKLGNTCLADCFFNDILNGRMADMMAAHFPGARINREIIGRENILPRFKWFLICSLTVAGRIVVLSLSPLPLSTANVFKSISISLTIRRISRCVSLISSGVKSAGFTPDK